MKKLFWPGTACLLLLVIPLHSHPVRKPDFSSAAKTVRDNPTNAHGLSVLAGLYSERGDFTNATALYRKCLLLEPDNSAHYLGLISVYLKMGRPDFAEPVAEKAVREFSQNPKVLNAAGNVRYKMGDYSNSVACFQRSLQLSGKTNDPFVYCGLAKSFRALQRFDRSEAYFRTALALRKDLWTFYEYGKLLEEEGNYEHAAWAFEKARSLAFREEKETVDLLQSRLAGAYYECGMKRKSEGRKAEARKCFEKILGDRGLKETRFAERAAFWLRRL